MSETRTLVEQLRARAESLTPWITDGLIAEFGFTPSQMAHQQALDIAAADEIERLQRADRNAAYARVHKLYCDLNVDRYGQPLIAALGLCLDLADELSALKTASKPNKQETSGI